MNRLEHNKTHIGKTAEVKVGEFTWKGIVSGVVDADTFLIKRLDRDKEEKVDIFDIISLS